MTRTAISILMVVAALGAGCAGSDEAGTSPTAPSTPSTPSTPPPPTTQPPPSNSCKPAAPGNFRVSSVGSNRTFNWDAVSGATSYTIMIGSESGASDLLNTNTTQTTYNWNGAGPGTYYARVYATNSCGSGATSPQLVFN